MSGRGYRVLATISKMRRLVNPGKWKRRLSPLQKLFFGSKRVRAAARAARSRKRSNPKRVTKGGLYARGLRKRKLKSGGYAIHSRGKRQSNGGYPYLKAKKKRRPGWVVISSHDNKPHHLNLSFYSN